MKAKDYYDKYAKRLVGDDFDFSGYDLTKPEEKERAKADLSKSMNDAVLEMIKEMSEEIQTLLNQRHCKTDSAVAGAVREINDRYNALARRLNEEQGFGVLKINGLASFWISRIPELKKYLKIGGKSDETV